MLSPALSSASGVSSAMWWPPLTGENLARRVVYRLQGGAERQPDPHLQRVVSHLIEAAGAH